MPTTNTKVPIVTTETLGCYDGKAGYSLAQGQ